MQSFSPSRTAFALEREVEAMIRIELTFFRFAGGPDFLFRAHGQKKNPAALSWKGFKTSQSD